MAEPALSPRSSTVLPTFKVKLAGEWKRKASCGRYYYDTSKLEAWMNITETGCGLSNAARLLNEVYSDSTSRNDGFRPSSRLILTGPDSSLLVFGILLDLGYGQYVDIFHKAEIVDRKLEDAHFFYANLKDELSRIKIRRNDGFSGTGNLSIVDKIVDDFDQARWPFCPARIKHQGSAKFHNKGHWILPFCKRKRVNAGGTAEVWQVSIREDDVPQDMKEAISRFKYHDKDFGQCYEMAVKSYSDSRRDFFDWEMKAFRWFPGREGMVRYLGDYSHDEISKDGTISRTHNILLEFGECDLDEYFAENPPPVQSADIVKFWNDLFEVAEALKTFHNLEYTNDTGYSVKVFGWHSDVKPQNILRVKGKFKLTDFGFAKFKQTGNGLPLEYIEGGTDFYGPPEMDPKRVRKGTRTAVTQAIDTWSFGCVLSTSVTWVILGWPGLEQFETLRKTAIRRLRGQQNKDNSISTPGAINAFHDGQKVLPEVRYWHQYLRTVIRTSDPISRRILDLVDDKMLRSTPDKRISSADLCEKLKDIDIVVGHEQKTKQGTETHESVLTAIRDFETDCATAKKPPGPFK